MKIPIPWAVHAYQSESLPLSAQELINLYPEISKGKAPVPLFRTPGLTLFGEVSGGSAVRGGCILGGVAYFVVDNQLYSIASDGTDASVGTLLTSSGVVSMVSDGSRIALVDGSYGYFYDTTSGLVRITDTDFNTPKDVTTQDGYMIFVQNDTTGRFQWTNDAAIDALDFATAEGDPDSLVGIASSNRELWLFGDKTIEVWWNDGTTPWSRIEGGFIQYGCGAQHSIANFMNTLAWLGDDGIIYRANGYAPERISTHPIEQDLEGQTFSDAVAWTHTWKGHEFYVISFPTINKTYAYDATTGLWHRRAYYSHGQQYYLCNHAVDIYGKTLVGSRIDGKIYELSDTYDENGSVIRCEMTSPVIHLDQRPFTCSLLEVDFEAGVGLVTGQGDDAEAMLQISRDSGKTWSDEKWTSIGSIGDYDVRARWTRLGFSRKGMVFKVAFSDPIKIVQMGSYANLNRGSDGD
jgi:hypothetical protein